ncbi:MAG: metallophosphatase [Prevotella shahii]|jgi:putative 5-nucleotidase|uniref:bifunctional metallophosphatase/5'-nucleotidase n=1 Tax=Hoylesella TaxID=2974257 RepID=UPI001C5CCA7A|nr:MULTISPECIES: metallophosphatase [Hoylesella]MBF1590257.1 metallophosphatase [Hoylesella shahii]MBW4834437.1 metallophosphatase [Hoylesella nanceiensis]
MKKLIIALSLAATFVATKSEAQTNSPAKSTEKGTKELVILHTNDTHSCIYPLNPQLADTLKAGRGGFLRRIAMLKEERKKNPDLLLFDSGDFSQGSPYYTLFKGDVEVGLMNKMHYDAVTIGNHEFDFGLKNMERLFKKANFPIVCANYDFTGTPLAKIVKPYVVLKRKGIKIGVFGLAPQLDGLVDAKNYETVRYINPITATNEVVSTLKNKEKCDLIICISHLGWTEKTMNDQILIPQTRYVDLVLGGHSHTFFETLRTHKDLDNNTVYNDQNGKSGIFIGKMTIQMAKNKH